MISLEQIKLLETKVEGALQKMIELKVINSKLETENMNLQAEVELLQEQCTRFEQDEAKIEQGILSVLNRLNTVEDTVRQGVVQAIAPQLTEQNPVPTQEVPVAQYSKPTPDALEIEPSVQNVTPDTVTESDPVQQQGAGMLNSAEKSAQLDIF